MQNKILTPIKSIRAKYGTKIALFKFLMYNKL